MLSGSAVSTKPKKLPAKKPERFDPSLKPIDEDSLAFLIQHLDTYMHYARSKRAWDGVTDDSLHALQQDFNSILPDRSWLEDKISARLYEINDQFALGVAKPTWLQECFCDLCYIFTSIIRYAGRHRYKWMNLHLSYLFHLLDQIRQSSEESKYLVFSIVQQILLQKEPLSSTQVPTILFKVGQGFEILDFSKILWHVSFDIAATNPNFLLQQRIREIRNGIRAKLKTYDGSPAIPVLHDLAWFYHDISVVHVRRPVVVSLLCRLLPVELAELVADNDVANYHPRLITKRLLPIYAPDDGSPDIVPKCDCEAQRTATVRHLPHLHNGIWLTCPHMVIMRNCYFSGYIRGLKHDHFVWSARAQSSLFHYADPVDAFTKDYPCRYPLDECPGHFDPSDTSWRLTEKERKAMQNAESILGSGRSFDE